jgi:hypothetical protein
MNNKLERLEEEDKVKWENLQVAIQKREEEEQEQLEKQYTGLESYRNSERQASPPVVMAPKEKPWWEKALDWVDDHQTEIALCIGVVVGGSSCLKWRFGGPAVIALMAGGQ